jgi:exodeoxyribonuclease VIII
VTTDYRKAHGVNWSALKHIDVSPLHYRHRLDHPTPPTAAMQAGTLAHLATLEPARFAASVVTPPDDVLGKGGRRSTKAYREWADAQPDDVTIASTSEIEAAQAIADAVRAHPVAGPMLAEARCEVPMFWTDPATGLECKGLADALTVIDGRPVLVDLKKARAVIPRAFERQAATLGYHGQMAHYAAGVEAVTGTAPDVYIVAVEGDAPHDVAVFHLDADALWAGEQYRRRLLDRLAECIERDDWPGVAPDVQPLTLPAWCFPDDDDPMTAIRIDT